MSPLARREYVRHIQGRYRSTRGRKEKSRLLTEVSDNLHCHRKHATRRMNGKIVDLEKPWRRRAPVYPERLIRVLEGVWEASQQLWAVRLKEALPLCKDLNWTLKRGDAKESVGPFPPGK